MITGKIAEIIRLSYVAPEQLLASAKLSKRGNMGTTRVFIAKPFIVHVPVLFVSQMKGGPRKLVQNHFPLILWADAGYIFEIRNRFRIAAFGIERFSHPVIGIRNQFRGAPVRNDLRK